MLKAWKCIVRDREREMRESGREHGVRNAGDTKGKLKNA